MVEGLIALNAGRVHDAIRCLADSLDPCLEDVQAASECGVLAPNLELVEKLVEHGERIEVLRHLSDCLDLWVRFRSEITEWMGIIERGDIPDFHSAESINEASRPSWKLKIQWLRACSLELEPYSTSLKARMSRTQVLAARAESAARHKAGFDAWVKKGIEYLENGLRQRETAWIPHVEEWNGKQGMGISKPQPASQKPDHASHGQEGHVSPAGSCAATCGCCSVTKS